MKRFYLFLLFILFSLQYAWSQMKPGDWDFPDAHFLSYLLDGDTALGNSGVQTGFS